MTCNFDNLLCFSLTVYNRTMIRSLSVPQSLFTLSHTHQLSAFMLVTFLYSTYRVEEEREEGY